MSKSSSTTFAIAELAYRALPKSSRTGRTSPIGEGGVGMVIPAEFVSLSTAELRAFAGAVGETIVTAHEAKIASSKARAPKEAKPVPSSRKKTPHASPVRTSHVTPSSNGVGTLRTDRAAVLTSVVREARAKGQRVPRWLSAAAKGQAIPTAPAKV